MYALLAIGVLLLSFIAYLSLRDRPRRSTPAAPTYAAHQPSRLEQLRRLRADSRFWGVAIETHCRAASRYAGHKFAFDDLPALPVEGCDSGECHCCLIGLPDQRKQPDRRCGTDRRGSLRLDSEDRRSQQPRRKDDSNSWASYGHL